ncbi:MAG TPA: GNAT family protein [Candidatus Dormibacteraeota bacterium]|nr:GNAT family protein [Candidatus Dormibacteraeota bacterium]
MASATGQRFPDDVRLQTARLLLRPFEAGDVPDVVAGCADELTQRWLPLPRPYTEADARAWCLEMAPGLLAGGDGIHWAAVELATGRLAGGFGLKRTDWPARVSEIGYWVAPWARGRGVATDAAGEIARWLLADQAFERLELRAATGNAASQRVAEKAGYVREGVLRNAGHVHGGRVDLVVFSVIPADRRSSPPP